MFQITSIYASILALGALALANAVSAQRAKTNISILHGDNMSLALAIRRHGNLIENVPLALLLMALAEARAAPVNLLHGVVAALVIGRVLHLLGLNATNPKQPLRIAGGVTTQIATAFCIGFLFWSHV